MVRQEHVNNIINTFQRTSNSDSKFPSIDEFSPLCPAQPKICSGAKFHGWETASKQWRCIKQEGGTTTYPAPPFSPPSSPPPPSRRRPHPCGPCSGELPGGLQHVHHGPCDVATYRVLARERIEARLDDIATAERRELLAAVAIGGKWRHGKSLTFVFQSKINNLVEQHGPDQVAVWRVVVHDRQDGVLRMKATTSSAASAYSTMSSASGSFRCTNIAMIDRL